MLGKLIVIEGGDGAGKSTQMELLVEKLKKEGREVAFLHFPKHDSKFGKVVDSYLRGEFGSKDALPSEFIAMLYLSDFYESKKMMEELLVKGTVIVLSRFFSSTLTYQVALEKKEKDSVWEWIRFVSSRLPQPDLVIVLDVPLRVSKKFMENADRAEGYKRGAKKDQHESDLRFQQLVRDEYERNISRLGWKRIDCTASDKLLSIEEIHKKVWGEVGKCLKEGKSLKQFF